MNKKLTIELVPKTCWFSNVRTIVSKELWDFIRKNVYANANNKCEICGGVGNKWPVECHEIWEYDDTSHTQKLKGFIALCPRCHQVKHFGYSTKLGLAEDAKQHLINVNGWLECDANEHIKESFQLHEQMSLVEWNLDVSILLSLYDDFLNLLRINFSSQILQKSNERTHYRGK